MFHQNFKPKIEYVELKFMMPFYEMYFPDTWNDNQLARNPFELKELSEYLAINLDTDFLYSEYEKTIYTGGDIYIFYPKENKNLFLYFDLLKDKYDQMAMIWIGVRIKIEDKKAVRDILEKLYFKSTTRSDFSEDYFNQGLHKTASDKIPDQKRIINHFMDGKAI
jgi:hypothetical protein